MKIGIDATSIYGPRTGIENYIINIVKWLLEIDKNNKYIIYCREPLPEELKCSRDNADFRVLKILNRKVFQQTRLPIIIYFDAIDVMFYPGNSLSLFCPCKTILTIHDIFPFVISDHIPKYHPNDYVASINTFYWKLMSQIGCKKANKLISVSSSTKSDVARIFSVPDHKTVVIPEAVSEDFKRISDPDIIIRFRNRYGINYKFLLCVGTSAYKNLEGSINAFLQLKGKGYPDLKLLITGSKERIRQKTASFIGKSTFWRDVKLIGYFPQEDMPLLYSAAELLLFPSFYEGFGIPVLEAFACGTPVVTSNISSLPEIAGDAAILVDPYNSREIVFSMERILNDIKLKKDLALKGLRQVRHFSWRIAAEKVLEVLEEIGCD